VLCLDDETYRTLTRLRLEHVKLVELTELELAHPELLRAKPGRKAFEYYWTCGPAFLMYIFQRHASIKALTYIDADLFFFGDPSPLHLELDQNSILLFEHRFSPAVHADHSVKGIYNVGLIIFRRTPVTLACLEWWSERCIEWCFGSIEPSRYGDQKYLEEWPDRFGEVTISGNLGGGLAPWNVGNYRYHYEEGRVFVDGEPLIFYHFNRLRVINRWLYDPGLWRYHTKMDPRVKREIYLPYVRELRAAGEQIRSADGRVHVVDNLIFGRNRWASLLRMARHRSFLIVSDRVVL
jgi:hypothetical protein